MRPSSPQRRKPDLYQLIKMSLQGTAETKKRALEALPRARAQAGLEVPEVIKSICEANSQLDDFTAHLQNMWEHMWDDDDPSEAENLLATVFGNKPPEYQLKDDIAKGLGDPNLVKLAQNMLRARNDNYYWDETGYDKCPYGQERELQAWYQAVRQVARRLGFPELIYNPSLMHWPHLIWSPPLRSDEIVQNALDILGQNNDE